MLLEGGWLGRTLRNDLPPLGVSCAALGPALAELFLDGADATSGFSDVRLMPLWAITGSLVETRAFLLVERCPDLLREVRGTSGSCFRMPILEGADATSGQTVCGKDTAQRGPLLQRTSLSNIFTTHGLSRGLVIDPNGFKRTSENPEHLPYKAPY